MTPERAQGVRLEIGLLGTFSLVWLVALLGLWGLLPTAGLLELDLYRLYSVAAVLGWLGGNIYVMRCRSRPKARRHLLLTYLIGPLGFVYLLRALAPESVQQAAPFVPLYCFVVSGLFFLVPVTLSSTRKPLR